MVVAYKEANTCKHSEDASRKEHGRQSSAQSTVNKQNEPGSFPCKAPFLHVPGTGRHTQEGPDKADVCRSLQIRIPTGAQHTVCSTATCNVHLPSAKIKPEAHSLHDTIAIRSCYKDLVYLSRVTPLRCRSSSFSSCLCQDSNPSP